MSVSRVDPQKVTLMRILDVLEEAFREKWGKGTIKCIIVVGGRRMVGRKSGLKKGNLECLLWCI